MTPGLLQATRSVASPKTSGTDALRLVFSGYGSLRRNLQFHWNVALPRVSVCPSVKWDSAQQPLR